MSRLSNVMQQPVNTTHVVEGGDEITGFNQRRFRSEVESAAEASFVVIADLSRTHRVDRWGLLTLFDLHERLKPRFVLVVSDDLRRAIRRLDPRGLLPLFSSVDEFYALQSKA